MADEINIQLPPTNEELEVRLLNHRADGHLRKVKTMAHTLEALVEDFIKMKRKMSNDGSLASEVLSGVKHGQLTNRRLTETKEMMSLLQSVVDLVESDVAIMDDTVLTGDKATGEVRKGRDILSVYSVIGNLE